MFLIGKSACIVPSEMAIRYLWREVLILSYFEARGNFLFFRLREGLFLDFTKISIGFSLGLYVMFYNDFTKKITSTEVRIQGFHKIA